MELAFLREHERAALHVAVAADVLRGRVEDDVGAQSDRLLEDRSRERVVHDGGNAGSPSRRDRRGEIGDLHERIRRRLEPDQPRLGPNRGREGGRIVHGDLVGPHAPTREEVGRRDPVAVVGVVGEDEVRSRPEGLHQGRCRRHARSEHQRRLPAFERRQRELEQGLRGVALPDVRRRADERVVLIARKRRRQVDGRGDGAGGRIGGVSGMDEERFQLHEVRLSSPVCGLTGQSLKCSFLSQNKRITFVCHAVARESFRA